MRKKNLKTDPRDNLYDELKGVHRDLKVVTFRGTAWTELKQRESRIKRQIMDLNKELDTQEQKIRKGQLWA